MTQDERLCPCHGEPMIWFKDSRRSAAGYWRCRLKYRAAQVRYEKSDKGRASQARYRATDKRRAARARYLDSDKGRATNANYEWGRMRRRRLADRIEFKRERIAVLESSPHSTSQE